MDKSKDSVLVEKTLAYLADASEKHGELKRIAAGANVGTQWLYKFKQGTIENPSPAKLEAVLRYGGLHVSVIEKED